MFEVGQLVRVLPPFGDGAQVHQVVAVQHVSAAGEIVPEPDVGVQYLVAPHPLPEGMTPENAAGALDWVGAVAFAPQWLEAAN
jgi:hypothetical protein